MFKEMSEFDYSIKAKILSVSEECDRLAAKDIVKERKEAYIKTSEMLRKLAAGRYVRRLRVYGC